MNICTLNKILRFFTRCTRERKKEEEQEEPKREKETVSSLHPSIFTARDMH